MKIKLLIIIFLSAFAFSNVSAHSAKAKMAQKLFSKMEYYDAAPMYDELAKHTLRQQAKGKTVNWDYLRKAALCNTYSRNYAKAAYWYENLAINNQADVNDLHAYFEVLRYIGNDTEAQNVLKKIAAVKPDDKLASQYSKYRENIKQLKTDSADYKINLLPFNKNRGDFGAAFYNGGLVYASARDNNALNRKYGRDNSAFLNLYYSKKDEPTSAYSKVAVRQQQKMMTIAHDGPVCFTSDGKTAFVTRNRMEKDLKKNQKVVLGIYILRKNEKGKWSKPEAFPYNASTYSVGHAALSADNKTIYFVSDMPGGNGGTDIWKSSLTNSGWSKPENLRNIINSAQDEMFPFIAADGTLFFSSKGHTGLGGLDIFKSIPNGNDFTAPENMGYPINSNADDFAYITNEINKSGIFSSDRNDFTDRIYEVAINKISIKLEGLVLLENTEDQPVSDAAILIRRKETGTELKTTTNIDGRFFAKLQSNSEYIITAEKTGLKLKEPVTVSTKTQKQSGTVKTTLYMYAEDVQLVVRIIDCETKQPVSNGVFWVKDSKTGNERKLSSNENGEIDLGKATDGIITDQLTLTIQKEFAVQAAVEGYLPAAKFISFTVNGGEGKIVKEICIDKIKKLATFKVEDIYYDFDKSDLRPLSITQLNKVYDFMILNPTVKVELSSHTDSRGSDAYNEALSQRRSQSSVGFLLQKQIPPSRIKAKGYGESKLVNQCSDGVTCKEEEHQLNRRTEIKILDF